MNVLLIFVNIFSSNANNSLTSNSNSLNFEKVLKGVLGGLDFSIKLYLSIRFAMSVKSTVSILLFCISLWLSVYFLKTSSEKENELVIDISDEESDDSYIESLKTKIKQIKNQIQKFLLDNPGGNYNHEKYTYYNELKNRLKKLEEELKDRQR